MTEQKPLGLVGLGLAGKALATRMLQAGYEVLGFDIHEPARVSAAALGVTLVPRLAVIASKCDVVLLSLPDSEVVGRVLSEEQLGEGLRVGTLVLDTTTGCPADATAHAEKLARRSVRFVDVTLSGSSEDIAAGEAVAMVGATENPELARLVSHFSRQAFYLGRPGAGCLAKLVVNHVMGLNRAALAEGLALGEKAGLDAAALLGLLHDSAAYSRVMDLKGRRMVENDYAPASRVAQHAKDVRLILELGQSVGARLPLEQVHHDLLEEAVSAGLGEQDNAALIEVFRHGTRGG